jgi:two-component system phosphate regulon response regulator OmpR
MTQDLPHILVVDDDTRLRELLRKFLADNGFRVSVAADTKDADQHLSGLRFDLIVLDRMMPGEEGLTFARRLRGTSNVPILVLTAMGEVEDRIDGLEVGVDDYLSKPFDRASSCCVSVRSCAAPHPSRRPTRTARGRCGWANSNSSPSAKSCMVRTARFA